MRVGASSGPIPVGCVGAGTGAVTGGIKGGLGSASEILETGLTVTALVAVNSLGSVISPATGLLWKVHLEVDGEFGLLGRRAVNLPQQLVWIRRPTQPSGPLCTKDPLLS